MKKSIRSRVKEIGSEFQRFVLQILHIKDQGSRIKDMV